MLQIYKGEATRSYENSFFRHFAKILAKSFELNGMKGILMGMPKSLLRSDLQIDALLVTKNTITIIDFKDYEDEIILPNENKFKYGRWETSSGITVKGGSSVNPFDQLGKQRLKLIQIFERTLNKSIRVQNNKISTMVCFSNPVKIIGNIPRNFKLSFFIADKNTFADKLLDIIDVETSDNDLLEKDFVSYLKGQVFEVRKYDLTTKLDEQIIISEKETQIQQEVFADNTDNNLDKIEKITEFLKSDSRVMIITGSVGSYKENIIPITRDKAHEEGFKEVKILALSNRVKNNLLRTQEDVFSLYSTIYDFSAADEYGDTSGRREIPLSDIDYYHEENELTEKRETLFIVEESQMISDTNRNDPFIQFGSDKLLSDLIEHLKLTDQDCPNKIIFIGDKYQLSFGSWDDSCLNPNVYNKWNQKAVILDFPDIEKPSEIQEECIQIADSINNNNYSDLHIHKGDNILIVDREKEREVIENAIKKPSSKILVYTNYQAHNINLYIKNKIINNGDLLAVGDLVIFDNQIDAYSPIIIGSDKYYPFDTISQPFDFTAPKRVENGCFGEIIGLDKDDVIESDGDFKDENGDSIRLTFLKAQIRLHDDKIIIETYVLEDFLYGEKSKLGYGYDQEYHIFLRKLMEEYMKANPFEKSHHFFQMISDENNYKKNNKGEFRDPQDIRKLTSYEKEYRKDVRRHLLRDPNSRYFKVYNSARIRFGWCLTVHRAMSYEWDTVSLSTDFDKQGRTNKEYFRFIYTGISRASHQVNLIRWRPVTPFEKTEFGIATNGFQNKNYLLEGKEDKTPVLLNEYLLTILNNTGIQIVDKNSKNYQELITFIDEKDRNVTLSFYYNKKFQIRYPMRSKGDVELFNKINQILQKDNSNKGFSIDQSPLYKIYCDLQRILHNSKIKVIKSQAFQDVIEILINSDIVTIQIWYTKDLMISKFNYLLGNKDTFDSIVERIGEYYGI